MSGGGEIEVSVVMPCLNEAESLGECIGMARRGLAAAGVRGEIVIADNGSDDGSQEIARELGARVIEVARGGYGAALMGGFATARGRFVVMGDADASYDFATLAPFIEQLRGGAELVMGNRFKGGIERDAMPFLNRYLGNPALSFLGRLFFPGARIGDFHCGLRAFRAESLARLDLRSDGMEFASEMVVKAALEGLAISEVPTTLAPAMRSRKPHLRPWRDGWRHLRLLLLFSPRWLFFYPGLALMALGLAMMIALLPGELRAFGVGFDVHTLVYASALIVVGYQAVLFAVFARIYAMHSGFLPARPLIRRTAERLSLETGALIGAGLIAAGVAMSLIALFIWGHKGFHALDYRQTLRLVIPASTLLILGVQTILASFFLSILAIEYSPRGRGE